MDHTVGHYLDAAKKQWLAERSDVIHLRSQFDMARGRIRRYEAAFQRLLEEGDSAVSRAEIEELLAE